MIVIKYGGHAMSDENGNFARAISNALENGITLVIVHGGGPQVDIALQKDGISTELIGGFRVTTPEIYEVVERVLS
ncbi:MAG: acetylglutamate kinase, partial [Actinobacteria bacterium]|nr:acetylglutamate kinase [Actinomycetota bacterium]